MYSYTLSFSLLAERPRAADSSLGEVGISAALMPTSPLEGLLSSGDAQPAGLLQDYRGLFPGKSEE